VISDCAKYHCYTISQLINQSLNQSVSVQCTVLCQALTKGQEHRTVHRTVYSLVSSSGHYVQNCSVMSEHGKPCLIDNFGVSDM